MPRKDSILLSVFKEAASGSALQSQAVRVKSSTPVGVRASPQHLSRPGLGPG
jgi:hypothetical protein